MTDVPAWALGGHSRATKAALESLIIDMRDRSGLTVPASVWQSKASMVDFIENARRAFWDRRAQTANASRTAEAVRAAHVATRPSAPITASECNDFLRTLPPIPLYGEPGCPFNPPRMEARDA